MNENSQINKHTSYYLKEKLKNFLELKEIIKSESLPSGFVYVKEGISISYYYIKSSNQPLDSTKLLGTIIIIDKLEVQMFISSALLPRSSYNPLLYSASTIKTTTEF